MRRAISRRWRVGPARPGSSPSNFPISRPAVSQHLKALRDGGLVVSHAEGTSRIYRLDPHGVAALRSSLGGVWEHGLRTFHTPDWRWVLRDA
jgi:DNA-binding transcriptional ArsR family regulator